MARQTPTPRNLLRRLRSAPERFAAAAAVYDPALLLALRAARIADERRAARHQTVANSAWTTRA